MDQKLSLVLKIEKNLPKTASVFEKMDIMSNLNQIFVGKRALQPIALIPPSKMRGRLERLNDHLIWTRASPRGVKLPEISDLDPSKLVQKIQKGVVRSVRERANLSESIRENEYLL